MRLDYAKLLQKEIPVKKSKLEEMYGEILDEVMEELNKEVEIKIDQIINELPNGQSSSIADNLFSEIDKENRKIYVITDNIVWDWLDKGTGIYNPEYAGKGIGGAIIPVNAKALHFKNREISVALGFPDENVFLKKIKGIKPRWFFSRHFANFPKDI